MRILGLALFIAALFVGTGQNFAGMFDVPSLLIVFGGGAGMLWLAGGRIGGMFKAVFSDAVDETTVRGAAADWKKARFCSLTAGLLGTLVGWIIMLTHMEDPEAIGPAMAIAVLTSMYALITAFGVCLPLQMGLARRTDMERDGSILITASTAVLIFVLQAYVMYFSLLVTVPSTQ